MFVPAPQAAAERVSGEHGHLDLLLNVAGILHTSDGISPGETNASTFCMHRACNVAMRCWVLSGDYPNAFPLDAAHVNLFGKQSFFKVPSSWPK